MAQGGGFTLMDYNREESTMSFNNGPITALTIAAYLTQFGALRTAIEGITLGTVTDERAYIFNTRLSNTAPTDEDAQVERAWDVFYEDSTQFFDAPINAIPNAGYQKVFHVGIPTADLPGRLLPESDFADLTDTGIAAFVTAFEAIAKSPYGGSVNVLQIKAVGRNR